MRTDVSGFEENELVVRLDSDRLTIQAEKKLQADKQRDYHRLFRQVTLPPGIDYRPARRWATSDQEW